MTASMRVMSAGNGYRYLLSSVAAGDGHRRLSDPLGYYTADGTPPGRWLGSGCRQLGDGSIRPGSRVEEPQLRLLLGEGRDPVTGVPLGPAYPTYQTVSGRRAVAGYDVTFSVPKSVSVVFAVSSASVQRQILEAHHRAIDDVLALFERDVAATRTGANTPDGAVAQVAVHGVAAVAFDHFDSRAGDPQVHTHLVISNKVKTAVDGRWRSLDGRPIHAAMVALSEHYNAVLADHLSRDLGVGWEQRDRGRDRNAAWEITGVPQQLIDAFSTRARAIDTATDELAAEYRVRHGRAPSRTAMIKLRQQATLATRPDKTVRSLAELCADWHRRATDVLGEDAGLWAQQVRASGRSVDRIAADQVEQTVIEQLGGQVVEVVGERRSTWRRWNLHAEASRQLMGVRFASTVDRDAVVSAVVVAAERQSVRLTPPDLAAVPEAFRRADGSSVFRPANTGVFTSTGLLAAEDRLLAHSRNRTGPNVPVELAAHLARNPDATDRTLGDDQAAAVIAVASSGRVVDVLVGPAGAGKTTAMRALRSTWEAAHGAGSVVGLAPSAAAAQVLAEDLGVATENTAKWLHDHTQGHTHLQAGQLVIIDEASLAGTHTLDRITAHAATVGAKVLLVGDPAQLGAVDAGGAFSLLTSDRDDIAELTDVRRFAEGWEAAASLRMRNGDPGVVDTFWAHGRLRDGDSEEMLDAAYTAWHTDLAAGRSSLLIAADRDTVTRLNERAHADRIAAGHVDPSHGDVALRDGTQAAPGDIVVTRRNDRRLHTARGWVRNGDRWTVTATHPDGSLTVHPEQQLHTAGVRLPAAYVADHVELGYATTVHRAQGATVDTAHLIATPTMTREALYVAMTRGRNGNTAYVVTDTPEAEPHQHTTPVTGRQVLAGILARQAAEASAHHTLESEQQRAGSITQLAAEYETIADAAQRPRWITLFRACGLTDDQAAAVIASPAFGPLCAALRHAEAQHHNIDTLLPRLVAVRPIGDVEDIAAVLHHRLTAATQRRTGSSQRMAPCMIAGLIPEATGPMPDDLRAALDQRRRLIEQRAHALAEEAIAADAKWVKQLGPPPVDARRRAAWARHARTVAAYRDRRAITTGDEPVPTSARPANVDTAAALDAVRAARTIAVTPTAVHEHRTSTRRHRMSPPSL